MAKKLINLLIEAKPEPEAIKRLKKISPIASISFLAVYVVLQVISLLYVQVSAKEYNSLKDRSDQLEKKIADSKATESLYVSTIGVLEKIKNILSKDTNTINNTLPVLFKIQNNNSVITTSSIDSGGSVGLFVKTSSLETMENFVENLKKTQSEDNFREINAAGILRENDGSYSFSVNLKAGAKAK